MSESKPSNTFNFTCPACHETSAMPSEQEGEFMPCPACGLSAAITKDDLAVAPTAKITPSPEELGYIAQQDKNARFARASAAGYKRVAYRVFRLRTFETWESLFEQTATFASSLPPKSLINISQSGGERIGSSSATVWYWEIIPVSERRIQAIQSDPKDSAPSP